MMNQNHVMGRVDDIDGAMSAPLTDCLTSLVDDVFAHAKKPNADYAVNARRGVVGHPIPFFGDPVTAQALTVGVNPSAEEFAATRWPNEISAERLCRRLQQYFQQREAPAHPWFTKWAEVLSPLGYDYTRNLAHLDISPRATMSMGSAPDQAAFVRMLEADAGWMFRLLPLCANVRMMFLAGAVSKKEYMFEFLRRVAPRFDFSLEMQRFVTTETKRQSPRLLRLCGRGVNLPVFFVSNSPSSRQVQRMLDDFARSYQALRDAGFTAADGIVNLRRQLAV